MRFLLLHVALLFFCSSLTGANIDTTLVRRMHGVLKLDLFGHGYYGYSYKQNQAVTFSAEFLCFNKSKIIGGFASFGGGAVISNPIGFLSASTGILLGKRSSFCSIGCAVAYAITNHDVKVRVTSSSSETVHLKSGAEIIPVVGYRLISPEKHITFSIYAAPHFTIPTFSAAGTIEHGTFWIPVGISIGRVL